MVQSSNSRGVWRGRVFALSGLVAALLLGSLAVRLVVGLASAPPPAAPRTYEIPPFAALLECNAHFSVRIVTLKQSARGDDGAELVRLHRNYRRLHRLMRQVGRRAGIEAGAQSERLRRRIGELAAAAGQDSTVAGQREHDCTAMAELPIARRRSSQLVVGR